MSSTGLPALSSSTASSASLASTVRFGPAYVPHECRFCAPSTGEPWNKVLWESDNFYVVPSKGGFVPGWLLIVPRMHVLSMFELPDGLRQESADIVARAAEALGARFGPPTMFEHGAVVGNSTYGCGIDHAHLHLVPLPTKFSLRQAAEQELGVAFTQRHPTVGTPYLRVRDPSDARFAVAEPVSPPRRQFFRYVLWSRLGRPQGSYEYDAVPCEAEVRHTLEALDGL